MASNDPRKRNGTPAVRGGDGAQAVPATPERPLIGRQAQQTGQAVAEAMAPLILGALPRLLVEAIGQALTQNRVQTVPLQCATCTLNRMLWTARHDQELKDAYAAYAAALAEIPEGDPRRAMINPLSFLPPDLQPTGDPLKPNPAAFPGIDLGTCMVGGTQYCPAHLPGAPDQTTRQPLLIATGALNPTMIAQARGEL